MVKLQNNLPGKIVVQIFFWILLGTIVYKVFNVPITHDEQAAALYYPTFSVWQIMMYPDAWPANHILNTLCIKLSEYYLGIENWTVRLHSVLSFILFYGIIWFIACRYFSKSWLLFCLPLFLMFCNPFLLDFFGLARGYALSNTLMACSVGTLLLFSSSSKIRWYYISIGLAMLAAYANFTLLIYWVALQILLFVIFLIQAGEREYSARKILPVVLFTAVLGVSFFLLCYEPLRKMQSTNQFIYWSKESFFKDTLLDQLYQFGYGVRYYDISMEKIALWLQRLILGIGVYVLGKIVWQKGAAFKDPLVIVFLLLILVWGINMLQTILLGIPFLTTRTALSYYVLFVFVVMFLFRHILIKSRWLAYLVIPIVIFLCANHLYKSVKLDSVREWRYDSDTFKVLAHLKCYLNNHPEVKSIDLNTSWHYNPSFTFYCKTGKVPWLNLIEYHKEVDTVSKTLFYYAMHPDDVQLSEYSPALDFPDNIGVLLIRKSTAN